MDTGAENNLTTEQKDRCNNLYLGGLYNVSNECYHIKYKIATNEADINNVYNALT